MGAPWPPGTRASIQSWMLMASSTRAAGVDAWHVVKGPAAARSVARASATTRKSASAWARG